MRRNPPAPQPLSDVCLNCGEALSTRFCGACGQENEPAAPSFSALIADLWQEFLQLDGKVLRTLWYLISRPGFLSSEYVSGRRIRYVSPFRLYFWATALFVLLFYKLNVIDTEELQRVTQKAELAVAAEASDAKKPEKSGKPKEKMPSISLGESSAKTNENHVSLSSASDLKSDAMGKVYAELLPSLSSKGGEILGVRIDPKTLPKTVLAYHDAQDALPKEKRDDLKRRFVTERVIRAKNNPFELIRSLIGGALPNILILCVPIWALMMKAFFPKRLYIEHTIFALHVHIFAIFVFGMRMILVDGFGWNNLFVRNAPLLMILAYNFVAGWRFYGQHPGIVLAKGAGLTCGYGCILLFAATLGIFITLLATFLNL